MGKPDKGKTSDSASPFDNPVVIPIEDSIDLHPFAPKDIPSVVEEYLEQCCQAGLKEVRIIHGRGIGIQRNIVRSVLAKHPLVLSLRDAPVEAGGWGATVVELKKES
jgi:dsDNA-specific endonuclease/ATPase MutS2